MPKKDLQNLIDDAGGVQKYARSVLENFFNHADDTPSQEEVSAESSVAGFPGLAFGVVTQCLDSQKSGRIKVQSKAFPKGPQTCDYVTPIGGAGYGFFAVPGIGSVVLVGKNPYNDSYAKHFWLGCLYAAGQREIPGVKSQPYVLGEPTALPKNEIMDNGEPIPDDPTVSYGVPNEGDVYQDNDLPDSFVFKHPAGHSMSLTDKNTPERQINEIKLKSAGNKRLIISDAPAPAGGESITLIDENENQVKITSVGYDKVPDNSIITHAGGDIQTYTKEGGIDQTISELSEGNFTVENAGKGDIDISSNNGHIVLKAETSITLECGGSTITLSPTGIDINTHTLNIKGGTGDVDIQGVTLLKHRHPVPHPGGSFTNSKKGIQ
mgnify:FL=1